MAGSRLNARAVALASLLVGVALVAAKAVVGVRTGSLAVISEAVHSLLDVAASIFALLALRAASRPADIEHPYGHGRAENLAAFAEGALLLFTALGIGYEALTRLLVRPVSIDASSVAIGLMVLSIVVEGARALVLQRAGRAEGSEAILADATNRRADVLSSLAVLVGLLAVRAGYGWADPVAALVVTGLVAWAAVQLLSRSGDILIDRAPAGVADALRRTIQQVEGVRQVNAVRVRRSGSRLIGDARISARPMLSLEAAQLLMDQVREAVAHNLPDLELILQLEGQRLADDLVERVHATAERGGQVSDVHNVTVEREQDGSLHLTMHARLPASTSLDRASQASAGLERDLRQELPEVSRVDVHLEPLEPGLVSGSDVTERNAGLAERIRRLVEAHPEVLSAGDVELSARDGSLVARVVARLPGSVTLEHAHEVESDLEERIAQQVPEVKEVVARATV